MPIFASKLVLIFDENRLFIFSSRSEMLARSCEVIEKRTQNLKTCLTKRKAQMVREKWLSKGITFKTFKTIAFFFKTIAFFLEEVEIVGTIQIESVLSYQNPFFLLVTPGDF